MRQALRGIRIRFVGAKIDRYMMRHDSHRGFSLPRHSVPALKLNLIILA